jgi:hypothetical protein
MDSKSAFPSIGWVEPGPTSCRVHMHSRMTVTNNLVPGARFVKKSAGMRLPDFRHPVAEVSASRQLVPVTCNGSDFYPESRTVC